MRRLAGLSLILAAAFVVFYLNARTGPAHGGGRFATVSVAEFDAPRAFQDITAIAASPHPLASPAHAAVRDYVFARMNQLGLSPQMQRAQSRWVAAFPGTTLAVEGPVENIVGVLPGQNRSLPAVAIMAHYDSVAGSPGAADDAAGVAVALETIRALKASQTPPARDVMVVITDGEEAGLLGARAFFDQNSLAGRIGFLVNIDVRGGGGRPVMFETAARGGAAVQLLRRASPGALANSATALAYAQMPNSTDFTVAKAHGVQGLNFGFIGRQFDYHSPTSTPATVDGGAVQETGARLLSVVSAAAGPGPLASPSSDLVYCDLFGTLVAYPPVWGWGLLAAAAALLLLAGVQAAGRNRPTVRSMLSGAGLGMAIMLAAAATLFVARQEIGAASGWLSYRPILARFPAFEAAMLMASLGTLVLVPALFADRARLAGQWLGLLALTLLLATALQLLAPPIGFVLAWPLAAGALAAALTAAGTRQASAAHILMSLIAVAALAWVGGFFHLLLEGLDIAPALALLVFLAALPTWPLLTPEPRQKWVGVVCGVLCLAISASVVVWLRASEPWSARYPRAVEPVTVYEADGSVWRASLAPADAWTRAWLKGAVVTPLPLLGAPGPMLATQIGRSAPPPLPITWSVRPGGDLFFAGSSADAGTLIIDVSSRRPLKAVTLDGEVIPLAAKSNTELKIERIGPSAGMSLNVTPTAGDRPAVRWSFWAGPVPPLPAMPADHMAWDKAGYTVVAGEPSLPTHH